jgi:hypothetical protein
MIGLKGSLFPTPNVRHYWIATTNYNCTKIKLVGFFCDKRTFIFSDKESKLIK